MDREVAPDDLDYEPVIRRPVRLYLTVEETRRLEILAVNMALTKSQTIRTALDRMYREELGGSTPRDSPKGPRGGFESKA